jgi:hypothetical protein
LRRGDERQQCAECSKVAEGDLKGWRALLGADPDDENAPPSAHLFCPECAEREFGPARPADE